MKIEEVKMDLFDVPRGYHLAYCITGDYSLGAGIARRMNEVYNMRKKLEKNYPVFSDSQLPDNDRFYVGSSLLVDDVFNLVTKRRPDKKAKYKNLRSALYDMKEQMEELAITKVAIPKLGCSHDKMDWDRVREIIEEVFEDAEVEILVCSL